MSRTQVNALAAVSSLLLAPVCAGAARVRPATSWRSPRASRRIDVFSRSLSLKAADGIEIVYTRERAIGLQRLP